MVSDRVRAELLRRIGLVDVFNPSQACLEGSGSEKCRVKLEVVTILVKWEVRTKKYVKRQICQNAIRP
jgi:hypothetical protein